MVNKSVDKVTWIDTNNISKTEVSDLAQDELSNYKIHQLIFDELLAPSSRSRVEKYNEYIFLVLHFPFYNAEKKTSEPYEIDFIITKDKLLTNRYGNFEPVDEFLKKVKEPATQERYLGSSPLQSFYYLLEDIFEYLLRQLHHINEKILELEGKIMEDNSQKFVKEILYVKRDILDFRRLVLQMRSILDSLEPRVVELFGESSKVIISAILGEYSKIEGAVEGYKDTVESLEHTHTSLLNINLSRIMKSFTVMAFMTFPLVLLVSILSINSPSNPLNQIPGAFYFIAGIVVALLLIMLIAFRKKHWL